MCSPYPFFKGRRLTNVTIPRAPLPEGMNLSGEDPADQGQTAPWTPSLRLERASPLSNPFSTVRKASERRHQTIHIILRQPVFIQASRPSPHIQCLITSSPRNRSDAKKKKESIARSRNPQSFSAESGVREEDLGAPRRTI